MDERIEERCYGEEEDCVQKLLRKIQISDEILKKKNQYLFLGVLALLGIFLLLIGDSETQLTEESSSYGQQMPSAESIRTESGSPAELDKKLAYTLSKMQGVGEVIVQITYKSEGRKEYAVDTQRTDRTNVEESEGTRLQTTETQAQTTIVQQNQSGMQQALLVESFAPEIVGVLVVAEGAEDALVREALYQAVGALLQVPMHQIMIVTGEENP